MNIEQEKRMQHAFAYLQSLLQSNEEAQAYVFFKNVITTEANRAQKLERDNYQNRTERQQQEKL